MAIGVLLVVAAAVGTYGYYRGAIRFLLALLPLVLASLLLWLFGPLLYRIDVLRSVGLVWPAFTLIVIAAIAGYALQRVIRKKLASKIRRADRIGGAVTGVLLSLIIVWTGCVYVTALSATRRVSLKGSCLERVFFLLSNRRASRAKNSPIGRKSRIGI